MSSKDKIEAEMHKMRQSKLEALEKGLNSDYTFLVGAEKDTAQLVHCSKVDLLIASDYFGGLIRSGDPCPVHVKHIQPHIFKMLIRVVSVHEFEEISNIEDAVSLALAADEFLMKPLTELCCLEIGRMLTVENVWQTLNSTFRIPKIAAVYSELLSSETIKFLEHPSFLKASKDSLIFLLEMEPLKIKSELDLLNACLKLANSWPAQEGFELMRAVLPHLRLLTLPTNDPISLLTKFLTKEEKAYLAGQLLFKEEKSSKPAPPSLNTNTNSRLKGGPFKPILELIPESLISDFHLKKFEKIDDLEAKFVCEIDVHYDCILQGMEILTHATDTTSSKMSKKPRIEAEVEYEEDLMLQVNVTTNDEEKTLVKETIKEKKLFNSWFYLAFKKKIVLRQGTKCSIEVFPLLEEASYLLIGETQVRDSLRAAKCSATKFECDEHEEWRECEQQNYIIKSVFFKPI